MKGVLQWNESLSKVVEYREKHGDESMDREMSQVEDLAVLGFV